MMLTGRHLLLAIAILPLTGSQLAFGQDIPWSLPRDYGMSPGPYDPQRRYDPRDDTGNNASNANTQRRNTNNADRYGDNINGREPNRYNAPANAGRPGPNTQYEWVLVPSGSTIPRGGIRGVGPAVQPRTTPNGAKARPEEFRGHVEPSLSVGRIDQTVPRRKQFQLGDYPPMDRDPTLETGPLPPHTKQRRGQQHGIANQQRPPSWTQHRTRQQSWPYQRQLRQTWPANNRPTNNVPTYSPSNNYGNAGRLPNEFSGPSTFENPYGYGVGGMVGGFGHPFLSRLPRY